MLDDCHFMCLSLGESTSRFLVLDLLNIYIYLYCYVDYEVLKISLTSSPFFSCYGCYFSLLLLHNSVFMYITGRYRELRKKFEQREEWQHWTFEAENQKKKKKKFCNQPIRMTV